MTTLAADALRNLELGDISEWSVIASDIIYQHAAVGLVDASGHARPLVGGDRFVGFAELRCDNAAGLAAAKTVRCIAAGKVQLSVSGAVITDIGQPVYATDDDTFVFSPVGGSFIGRVHRFVSSGVVIVKFNVNEMSDPYGNYEVREALTSTKTFDAEDNGKLFWCTGDGSVLTLPAVAAGLSMKLVAGGAFGTMAMAISPNASDAILGRDLTAVDDKDLLLTKATQRRGDYVVLQSFDADGYVAAELRGIWTKE